MTLSTAPSLGLQYSIRINDQWRVCFERSSPASCACRRTELLKILNGQRSVTGDTALRFGHFFHTSPEFWLNLQAIYDLENR